MELKNPKVIETGFRFLVVEVGKLDESSQKVQTFSYEISKFWGYNQHGRVREHGAPFSSVTQLYPTLRDPMNCSTPDLPVHHQLLESSFS